MPLQDVIQAFEDRAKAVLAEAEPANLVNLFRAFKAELAPIAPNLGVPTNLRMTGTTFADPTHAVCSYAAELPEGADEVWFYHSDGNPFEPFEQLIGKSGAGTITIDGLAGRFAQTPGDPFTLAAYGAVGGRRAAVPVVEEFTIPAYAPPAPPAPAFPTPVATVAGSIAGDSLMVALAVGAPGADLSTATPTPFVADTGAYECALDATTAVALGLPDLGPATVGGVGGSVQAFNTEVDVQVGETVYRNVHAVAIEGFGQNLWGLRFAIDRQYIVALNTVAATLSYYQA